MRALDQSQPALLPGTEEGASRSFPRWPMDRLPHARRAQQDLRSGRRAGRAREHHHHRRGGSWDADGSMAVPFSHATPLTWVPSAGGSARPFTKLATGEVTHRWPQFLPGGNVLFTQNESSSGMEAASLQSPTGKPARIKSCSAAATMAATRRTVTSSTCIRARCSRRASTLHARRRRARPCRWWKTLPRTVSAAMAISISPSRHWGRHAVYLAGKTTAQQWPSRWSMGQDNRGPWLRLATTTIRHSRPTAIGSH